VWARLLRINNAETYEKMRKLFRERYVSRIDGLVKLMKTRKGKQAPAAGGAAAAAAGAATSSAASAASVGLSSEEVQIVQELQMQDNDALSVEWQSKAGEVLEEFTAFVHDTFKDSELSPHIELQDVSVEVRGWLEQAVVSAPNVSKLKALSLKNIALPHHFLIEKSREDGHVYLYNKYLANSTELLNDGVHHQYRAKTDAGGDWTTRAKLYNKGDSMTADPFRIPPIAVDTHTLRETVRIFKENSAMSQTDVDQFQALLARLDDEQKKQAEVCARCAELSAAYSGFGTIRRAKDATEGEKKEANKKNSSKDAAWSQMMAHLYDPEFADVHNAGMVHTNFWTKWLDRVREHILPSYVKRGFITNPSTADIAYHAHPRQLVSNGNELPCMDAPERADVSWLMKSGVPRVGQMTIVRGGDSMKEPVWVGIIRRVEALTEEARVELKHADHVMAARELKSAQVAAATAAAAARPAAPGLTAAAAAAVAPSRAPSINWRIPLKDVSVTLKAFHFTVEFWDLHTTCFWSTVHLAAAGDRKEVKLASKKFWSKLLAEHGMDQMDLDALQEQLLSAAAGDSDAPPPLPLPWIVDLYEGVSFIPPEREGKELRTIRGPSMVMWGPREELLCKGRRWNQRPDQCDGWGWKIRTHTWKPVREDLTEQFLDPHTAAAESETFPASSHEPSQSAKPMRKKAASATKRKNKKQQSDEESSASEDDNDSGVGIAAAATVSAAAPASRKVTPRRAKAKPRNYHDDEESAAEEEQSEEDDAAASEEEEEKEEESLDDDAPLARLKAASTKTTAQAQRSRACAAVQLQASPKRKRVLVSANDEERGVDCSKRPRVSAAAQPAASLTKKRSRQTREREEDQEGAAAGEHDGAPPAGSSDQRAVSTRPVSVKRTKDNAVARNHAGAASTHKGSKTGTGKR
jgi:hypothetical protein